jgi:hypothetical protein
VRKKSRWSQISLLCTVAYIARIVSFNSFFKYFNFFSIVQNFRENISKYKINFDLINVLKFFTGVSKFAKQSQV